MSTDRHTNSQIIENFNQTREGASLELGRLVDISTFTGFGALRMTERLAQAESRFGWNSVLLQDIAATITLGRPGSDFTFAEQENAILIPLIGISDVVDSVEDASLKLQDYAQAVIDPTYSDARFVAHFLNSEFGKEIRESAKTGATIPRLNKQSLLGLRLFIPDRQTQQAMLATEARIAAEENALLGLQNEIAECRRDLWAKPKSQPDIAKRLDGLSARLSSDLRQETSKRLDQWFESLPFPMASILRAWQAAPSDDFKTKYEHLLHFFEASAEFGGIILLSAFRSREQLFADIRDGLSEALTKQNLSFRRATFGTWKIVIEYLGKRARQFLSGDKDQRAACGAMFADTSLQTPEVLASKEIARIVSATNKMRNDWAGHGGVVGPVEAKLRNERLLGEVQRLREATGDLWANTQLVQSLQCRPRRGLFENEVAVLMGSNSEFLKETRPMPIWLDVERLYVVRRDEEHALQLLPLVKVGPSPTSAMNACYFFSRIEKEGLRYVSYHFIEEPQRNWPVEDAAEAISLLQNG